MKKTFLTLFLLFHYFISFSVEQTKITGIVTDEYGIPLDGVRIKIKNNQEYSSQNGDFSIPIAQNSEDTLTFIKKGKEIKNLNYTGQDRIHISLKSDPILIDSVIVIGYDNAQIKDLTGAISCYKFDNNNNHQFSNSVSSALTGKIAGLNIVSSEGALDASSKITIRGGSSITQNNTPLIILDGFPINSLDEIPLGDIETINVLKDASATAIYGSQGANGVIIVSTYKGIEGKISISYNSYYGIRKIAKEIDVLSSSDYTKLQYELASSNSQDLEEFVSIFGEYSDLELYNQDHNNINWQDKLFGKDAFFTSQNLTINGGNSKNKYRLNYLLDKNNGIMTNSRLTKNILSLNMESRISKKLLLETYSTYLNKKVLGAGTSGENTSTNSRLKNAVLYSPISNYAFGSNIDDFSDESSLYNPLTVTNNDYKQAIENSLKINLALSYDLFNNKKIINKTEISGWIKTKETNHAYGLFTSQANNYGNQPLATILTQNYNKKRECSSIIYKILNSPKNHLKLLLGEELIENNSKYNQEEARYFPSYLSPKETLANMSLGEAQPITTYIYPSDRLFSIFGRVNYEYENKYLITFTTRADRSSKFSNDNQWGFFPATALAWRFSQEKFTRNNDWLNNGKLRLSYGLAGNNNIGNNLYKLYYTAGSSDDPAIYYNEESQTFIKTSNILPNPKLKWETNITRDIGLDLDLFNEKISIVCDVYYNSTKDLLINSSIATESGYAYMMRNIGETSNKGVEFSINGTLIKNKKCDFEIYSNLATNKNRIENLGQNNTIQVSSGWAGSEISSDYILKEGQPVGQMYGYVTDGYYKIEDFNYNQSTHSYTLKDGIASDENLLVSDNFGPGSLKLKDLDGDGIITENDRCIIGDANPKATGGFGIKVRYKNWDFNLDAYWEYGNDVYNANKIEFTTSNKYKYRNMSSEMSEDKRWTYIDENGNRVTDPEILTSINSHHTIWSPIIGRYIFHSWAVEDGSFLRISKITLGYTLPKRILQKFKIENIRVYGSIDNLYCFTKYSGYDPEVDSRNSTPLTPSVDYSAYPKTRAISLGLNINF